MAKGKRKAKTESSTIKKSIVAIGAVAVVTLSYSFIGSDLINKAPAEIKSGSNAQDNVVPEPLPPATPVKEPTVTPEIKKSKPIVRKPKVKIDPYKDEKILVAKLDEKGYTEIEDYDLFKRVSFRVGTFNVLGNSHTSGKDARKGYLGAQKRLPRAVRYIRQHNLSIVGLQEFQTSQARQFNQIAPEYSTYPGVAGGYRVQNSITWRSNTWELVEAHNIAIPYFGGRSFEMPYIKLENIETGKFIWVANFHNPANAHGNAQKYRNEARKRQVVLANELAKDGLPVIFTGDFNEQASFACPFSQATGFQSAEGTRWENNTCVEGPKAKRIDWIFYKNLLASDYALDTAPEETNTSDHPLVTSTFGIDPTFDLSTCKDVQLKNQVKRLCLPYTTAE